MSFNECKDTIKKLMDSSYKDFVKALVSIEYDIDDEDKLDEIYMNFLENDSYQLLEIGEMINDEWSDFNLSKHYPKLNKSQLKEVEEGIKNNLSEKEISIFAKPELSPEQMLQIRYALSCKIAEPEVINKYSIKEFSPEKLRFIFQSFELGLTQEQVDICINPKFTDIEMFYERAFFLEENKNKEINEEVDYEDELD